ncbi:MAG TPA: hypothetical protein VGM30_07060 [Puia sp.]
MSTTTPIHQSSQKPSFTTALLLTALLAGTLDAIGATTSYLLHGNPTPPISGAMSPAAPSEPRH